jgi:hypothetical protein
VVTVLFARAALDKVLQRKGAARLVLSARENIFVVLWTREGMREDGNEK